MKGRQVWRRSCYRRYGFDRIAAAGLIILAMLTIGYCVNWIYVHHLFVRLTNEGWRERNRKPAWRRAPLLIARQTRGQRLLQRQVAATSASKFTRPGGPPAPEALVEAAAAVDAAVLRADHAAARERAAAAAAAAEPAGADPADPWLTDHPSWRPAELSRMRRELLGEDAPAVRSGLYARLAERGLNKSLVLVHSRSRSASFSFSYRSDILVQLSFSFNLVLVQRLSFTSRSRSAGSRSALVLVQPHPCSDRPVGAC